MVGDSLRWLLNLGTPPDAESVRWRLDLRTVPQGGGLALALLGVAAALAAVWFLYRRDGRDLSARQRVTLALLRLGALAAALLMLCELVAVQQWDRKLPTQLIALVDASQSMGLRDPYPSAGEAAALAKALDLEAGKPEALRQQSRLALAKQGLAKLLPRLAEGRTTQVYGFGGRLDGPKDAESLSKLGPAEPTTNIGDALRDALAAHRGQPIAGVLLISDGRNNGGADPLPIAVQMGKDGIPIVALAAGTPEGPQNVRLADMQAPPAAFQRDPIDVPVLIESRGKKGVPATVTLERRLDDGPWQEVGSQVLTLGEDGAQQLVKFRLTSEQLGRLDLRAKVADAGPELTLDDNVATASVRIVRQRLRVLMISGTPTAEAQFLKNALMRDRTLEFYGWLQGAHEKYDQPGDKPLKRLPQNQEELDFYDALLLIDPDMQDLGPQWSEMLTHFVGRGGGGLVYVAGASHTPALFDPASEGAGSLDNSWAKILPVAVDPGLYRSSAEVKLSALETWLLEQTPQGLDDPVFAFEGDPAKNKETLASLPGMYWHFPVTRPKPGATTLARHGDPRMKNQHGRHVLLATQLYGPGRTVFVGFDSTHRWRYLNEQHFDGFWARLIDRVGRSKALGGGFPFSLTLDRSAFRLGEAVTIHARFVNPADRGTAASLPGELEIDGRPPSAIALEPSPQDPEAFKYTFTPTDAGAYQVRVRTASATGGDASTRPVTANFRVEPPRRELDAPTLNMPLLEALAKASGGQALPLARLDEVPAAFPAKIATQTMEESRELWHAPIMYLGMLLALTLEWSLRKYWRLA